MRKVLLLTIAVLLLGVAELSPAQAASEEPTTSEVVPTTPVLSARRFPGALVAPTSDEAIVTSLETYLAKVNGSTCAIVELDGREILRRDPTEALAPASTLKLATAVAAMDILGRDHVFTTRFATSASFKNGTIDGDLYVIGGGDPLLITPGYKTAFDDPDQFYEELNSLVDVLADAGVTEISGDLIGDESRYDATRWIPTWPTRYQIGGTVAPLSALLVNDGSTGYTETPNAATATRKAGDPPILFVETLRTLLSARGIKVSGTVDVARAPDDVRDIASFDSVPLAQVLNEMLIDSDNTTAELVTREIGLVAKGQGTTSAGIEAIKESLVAQGFDTSSLVMLDGSGLDTGDRMDCELALALANEVAVQPDLLASLPVGGRSGTLRKRMLASASTGRVRAKTGTLNSVNALAGFVDTTQGSVLTFAFLHNGNDSRTTGVADGFTDRLVAYAKDIKSSALEPLEPK